MSRLRRNKGNRIPETIARLENIYKLLDKKCLPRNQLLQDLDFWGPTVMAQERKLRRMNEMWDGSVDSEKVKDVRNVGRHVGKKKF